MELFGQLAAVGMWVRSHAPVSFWSQFFEFRYQSAFVIEQLFRPVALEPLREFIEVLFIFFKVGIDHLMRTEAALIWLAVDRYGSGPAFWRHQDYHRPAGAGGNILFFRIFPDASYLHNDLIQFFRHCLVHCFRICSFDDMRCPAVSLEQLYQFFLWHAGKYRRIGYLESIQMEDREHGTVVLRIEEFVQMPRGCKRPCFRFAVSYDAGSN